MLTSGNTFACCKPGFWKSSNDNTRPTTDCVFPFGAGVGIAGVVEVVGEAVVVWALVFVSVLVVWVVSELDTVVGVSTVASEDWVIWAGVLEIVVVCAGTALPTCVVADAVAVFTGLIGDVGFVGLFIDFLQLSDVVAQGPHTGCPYGSGHIEERVWVMLPV